MKLPHSNLKHSLAIILGLLLIYIPVVSLVYFVYKSRTDIDNLRMNYSEVKQAQDNFQLNLSEELFNEHLSLQQKQNLENKLSKMEMELAAVKKTPEGSLASDISEIYDLYGDFEAKVARNDKVKLDTKEAVAQLDTWGGFLIEKNFEVLKPSIEEAINELDATYEKYLATLPPPEPPASSGYSRTTVATDKGSFGVYLLKLPLSSVRVKTVSANSGDCSDNCPTKSLQDLVNDTGGFAGMNGSYFCPPDYASCGGKVNSYDYALYSSNNKKWINKDALSWFKTGLFTFKGNSYEFYNKSSDYDGDSVDGGISNYPSLVKNGEVIVKDGDLTSYQKIKGTRGAIGAGNENLYLAIISNATVEEAAYVMRSLGAKNALNLDGGGSSAMYIDGRYVVGPGRSLPNAIVLVR